MLGVYVLEPPYAVCHLADCRAEAALPQLGAVLVCDLSTGPSATRDLATLHARIPWCPVAAVVPAQVLTQAFGRNARSATRGLP